MFTSCKKCKKVHSHFIRLPLGARKRNSSIEACLLVCKGGAKGAVDCALCAPQPWCVEAQVKLASSARSRSSIHISKSMGIKAIFRVRVELVVSG